MRQEKCGNCAFFNSDEPDNSRRKGSGLCLYCFPYFMESNKNGLQV